MPSALPSPTLEERIAFLQSLLDNDQEVRLAAGLTAQEMARLCTGLRYIDLEEILLRASFQIQAMGFFCCTRTILSLLIIYRFTKCSSHAHQSRTFPPLNAEE